MSFKDQLRNYIGGAWQDFWRVSPYKLLGVVGSLVFAIALLLYRTHELPPWVETVDRALSPVTTLLMLIFLGRGLYRRFRGLFR